MSNPGFIIGGGPSLRGFDFEALRDLRCMAINVAFKDVPWAEVAYVGYARLLDQLADDPEWGKFEGLRYTRSHQTGRLQKLQPQNVNVLRRADAWQTDPSRIASLGNSGLSGVNLAEQLGWSPIFLLGFDCGGFTKSGKMANYHDRYPDHWRKPGSLLMSKFTDGFRKVLSDITAEVYNSNPQSELDCFPKVTFEEAVALYVEAEGQSVQTDVC